MRQISWFAVLLAPLILAPSAREQADQQPSPIPPSHFDFKGAWDCRRHIRDVEPATGYVAKYLIGYDPQLKRLVEFDANNFGAATYSSARGWVNGVLTMNSPVSEDPKASYAANRF